MCERCKAWRETVEEFLGETAAEILERMANRKMS
jgi:hypothetical protein